MSNTQTRNRSPARDVLYEFALAASKPDAELLEQFVRRYPEHAAELTDFAVLLALDFYSDSPDTTEPVATLISPVVSRAMSRFENRLYAVKQEAAGSSAPVKSPDNPFATLDRKGVRDFCSRLPANNLFFIKMRDRQIDGDTMTSGFSQHVANGLPAPLDIVVAHFATGAERRASTHLRADNKPDVPVKQTFEEAVRTSGLTEEQQKFLLSL
jgi:hypothetical protein